MRAPDAMVAAHAVDWQVLHVVFPFHRRLSDVVFGVVVIGVALEVVLSAAAVHGLKSVL